MAVPIRFCVNQFGGLQNKKNNRSKTLTMFFFSFLVRQCQHRQSISRLFFTRFCRKLFLVSLLWLLAALESVIACRDVDVESRLGFLLFFVRMSGKFHSKPEPYYNEARKGVNVKAKKSNEKKLYERKIGSMTVINNSSSSTITQTVAKCKKYGRATNRWEKTTTTTTTKYAENK